MSKELDAIAKQFHRDQPTVLHADFNLYQSTITRLTESFLRAVEQKSKQLKKSKITLIAVISD